MPNFTPSPGIKYADGVPKRTKSLPMKTTITLSSSLIVKMMSFRSVVRQNNRYFRNNHYEQRISEYILRRQKSSSAQAVRLVGQFSSSLSSSGQLPTIPKYLKDTYWWAYINPVSIRILDRQSIVNMILWGNFNLLRDEALKELSEGTNKNIKKENDDNIIYNTNSDGWIQGKTLQVACVYGDFTEKLYQRMALNDNQTTSSLDVIDVVPAQLNNLMQKLDKSKTISTTINRNSNDITLSCYNADNLIGYDDDTFDQVVFFFLLHEMPSTTRRKIIKEVLRVVKSDGGKMIFVDYHKPESLLHRFMLSIVFYLFEPYAKDMWNNEIKDWFPRSLLEGKDKSVVNKDVYCDGLYQKVVVIKK